MNSMLLFAGILCAVSEEAATSTIGPAEGLILLFATMDVLAVLFYIWLKTPAGKNFLGED